ncbi:hypothetical protein, partial [Serratia marcescens]|uniref:hypothetical protein n=1 Tax=Serratia marcescens TaxID=615 RepID=UPI0019530DCE
YLTSSIALAMGSGFAAFIGVLNIGIVATVKNKHVLSAAFSYGLVVMMGTVPLFGRRRHHPRVSD